MCAAKVENDLFDNANMAHPATELIILGVLLRNLNV